MHFKGSILINLVPFLLSPSFYIGVTAGCTKSPRKHSVNVESWVEFAGVAISHEAFLYDSKCNEIVHDTFDPEKDSMTLKGPGWVHAVQIQLDDERGWLEPDGTVKLNGQMVLLPENRATCGAEFTCCWVVIDC
jgi:hypothetical protein